jgi:hypothetical protein
MNASIILDMPTIKFKVINKIFLIILTAILTIMLIKACVLEVKIIPLTTLFTIYQINANLYLQLNKVIIALIKQ